MTVKLDGLRLWNGSESQSSVKGDVKVDSVPTMGPDEALLTSLTAVQEFSLTGVATGNLVSQQPGYSSDPERAIREWATQFLGIVNGKQGSGYTLQDGERAESFNVLVEEVGVKRERGNPLAARWDISCIRGNGASKTGPRATDTVDFTLIGQGDSVVGHNLGQVTEKKIGRKEKMKKYPLSAVGENAYEYTEVLSNSGAVETISITGMKHGTFAEMNAFATAIQAEIGADRLVQYQQDFPGVTTNVMIKDFSHTYKAGEVDAMEYSLTLQRGYDGRDGQ